MTITTGTLTACAGGEHLELPVTVNGNTNRTGWTIDLDYVGKAQPK